MALPTSINISITAADASVIGLGLATMMLSPDKDALLETLGKGSMQLGSYMVSETIRKIREPIEAMMPSDEVEKIAQKASTFTTETDITKLAEAAFSSDDVDSSNDKKGWM